MFRILRRSFFLAGIIFVLGPVLITLVAILPKKLSLWFKKLTFFLLRQSLGIKKVHIIGELSSKTPIILMCNHISYADIVTLGCAFPAIQFISKEDVRQWPIIGWGAPKFGTLFISRHKNHTRKGLFLITQQLSQGNMLLLFPEGTTSDGCQVLPFKSPYFNLPPHVFIQSVSLRYGGVNGMPAHRFFQKIFSWRGNVTLVQHLKQVLGFRRIEAVLCLHPAVSSDYNRKAMAIACHRVVQRGFESLLTGDGLFG